MSLSNCSEEARLTIFDNFALLNLLALYYLRYGTTSSQSIFNGAISTSGAS